MDWSVHVICAIMKVAGTFVFWRRGDILSIHDQNKSEKKKKYIPSPDRFLEWQQEVGLGPEEIILYNIYNSHWKQLRGYRVRGKGGKTKKKGFCFSFFFFVFTFCKCREKLKMIVRLFISNVDRGAGSSYFLNSVVALVRTKCVAVTERGGPKFRRDSFSWTRVGRCTTTCCLVAHRLRRHGGLYTALLHVERRRRRRRHPRTYRRAQLFTFGRFGSIATDAEFLQAAVDLLQLVVEFSQHVASLGQSVFHIGSTTTSSRLFAIKRDCP